MDKERTQATESYGIHVMPSDDLREHIMSLTCWCYPEDDEGVIIHNALDGREDFETGKRLPS